MYLEKFAVIVNRCDVSGLLKLLLKNIDIVLERQAVQVIWTIRDYDGISVFQGEWADGSLCSNK